MFTEEQFFRLVKEDRLTLVLQALIEKRVTSTTVISGTSRGGAAALVADALLIVSTLEAAMK